MNRLFVVVTSAVALLGTFGLFGEAQAAFPEKNIRVIVPFKAGGGSDVSARLFAKYWEKQLPVKVVVTNIDGGAGILGESETLKSKPDGYTLLWQHHQMLCAGITGFAPHSWQDFTPVYTAVTSPFALVIGKNVKETSAQEILDSAKKNPGKLSWAFSPMGNTQFYFLDIINNAGLPQTAFRHINNIPGDANRILAMLQGNIDVMVNTVSSVMPYHLSKDVKILALTGESKLLNAPEIKTLKELGIPSVLGQTDYIVFGPKGVDPAISKILADSARKALDDPELIKEADGLGIIANFHAGEDLRARIENEYALMKKLADTFNIKK